MLVAHHTSLKISKINLFTSKSHNFYCHNDDSGLIWYKNVALTDKKTQYTDKLSGKNETVIGSEIND